MIADIPFNRPSASGDELRYLAEALASGHISTGGPFSRQASDILRDFHDAPDVLLTTSCTDALEMSAMLLGVGPGDVVVVPSFTFTSTALAFARERATLRFCDIDPERLSLDPDHLQTLVDDRVKAIVPVHYGGVPAELERIGACADTVGADIVEDNAHGLFGTKHGRPLGTFGRFSTLSFHETKNFICGEGGALVVNRDDDVLAAHVLLDKGTNRKAFLDGLVDKYSWQGLGSSFGLSDLLAALLLAQLHRRAEIQAARRAVSMRYRAALEGPASRLGVRLPFEDTDATPTDHLFYVLLPDGVSRAGVLSDLSSMGVHATFHYVPLHSTDIGRRLADRHVDCPVTDDISARLIRLPFYNELDSSDQDRVVEALVGSLERRIG